MILIKVLVSLELRYKVPTLSLVESFIESEVPHLKLFLVKSMMPLKRWVVTEKVLTALLGNEV